MHAEGLLLLRGAPARLARGRRGGVARLPPLRGRGTSGRTGDVRVHAAAANRSPGEDGMTSKRLLATGIVGTVVAALCCATPVLAIVLGALGLSAWRAYSDYVVLPAMIVFITITGYALWRPRLRHP